MSRRLILTISLPIILLVMLFALPRPSVEIEPARPQFWPYPDVSQASYNYSVDDAGKIHLHIEHPLLRGVTPKMLAWWYQYLAIGEANIAGTRYPYYQLFHLSEHGQMHLLEPASDGSVGMGVGALVYRQETFGPFASKGKGRVVHFGVDGYVVTPVMGGLSLGSVRHSFQQVAGGTLYTVDTVLGSDLPVIGWLINSFIQHRRFPPAVLKQWIRHQVEEVGSLPHFLPHLYTSSVHEQVFQK